jgi:CHAD domain-containing protein
MLADDRKAEKVKLARHLRSMAYDREMSDLEQVFASCKTLAPGPKAEFRAKDYACSLIWTRYRKICRIADGIGPATEDDEIHALRIHCKKLRYLMEFFAPSFSAPEFKSLIKALKALQDNLGLINDYAVQQTNLQLFLREGDKWRNGVDLEVAKSVGALISTLHGRQVEERAQTDASLVAFNDPQTQQTFRDLFREGRDKP